MSYLSSDSTLLFTLIPFSLIFHALSLLTSGFAIAGSSEVGDYCTFAGQVGVAPHIKIGDKSYKTLRFNFRSSDETLPESKKLNTDIWYEEDTYLWVRAAFEKTGYWEYRIKKVN